MKLSETVTEAETFRWCLEEADDVAAEAGVIINALYTGINKKGPLPLPAEALTIDKMICDAVYKAVEETALIRQARAAGVWTMAGCWVLLHQGVRWVCIGKEASVEVMSDALA